MNRFLLFRLLLDAAGGEGGGTPPPKAEEKPPEKPPETKAEDKSEGYKKLLDKHQNDALAALRDVYDDNYRLRQNNRELKGKLPGEGARVLAGDDARAWDRYREIGSPDDLKAAVADRDKFKGEAEGYRRRDVHAEAARLAGYNAEALDGLAKDHTIEIRDAVKDGKPVKDKDGKPVRIPVVVEGQGDTAKATPLEDFAKANWSAYLPALKPTATRPAGSPTSVGKAAPKPEIRPEARPRSLVR